MSDFTEWLKEFERMIAEHFQIWQGISCPIKAVLDLLQSESFVKKLLQGCNPLLESQQMKAAKTRVKKIGRGYSCLPKTHERIESERIARGLKSGGQVLDAIFSGAKR